VARGNFVVILICFQVEMKADEIEKKREKKKRILVKEIDWQLHR